MSSQRCHYHRAHCPLIWRLTCGGPPTRCVHHWENEQRLTSRINLYFPFDASINLSFIAQLIARQSLKCHLNHREQSPSLREVMQQLPQDLKLNLFRSGEECVGRRVSLVAGWGLQGRSRTSQATGTSQQAQRFGPASVENRRLAQLDRGSMFGRRPTGLP